MATVPVVAGEPDWEEFEALASEARLVVASAVDWEYGYRLSVPELVERARGAGARVLIDAVQAVGTAPVDLGEWGADFVVLAGHEWLLSPEGAGVLYVRDGVEDWLTPERIGYRGVREPPAMDYRFEPGARRLEIGSTSPAPHVGLAAALEAFKKVGPGVYERVTRLTDRLVASLDDGRVAGPTPPESGLVTGAVDDPEAVEGRLAERGIHVRTLPGVCGVRASVHAFNTESEVDRLAAALGGIASP